ncbi:MAG: metal ABC transporter ATP-binding protein [Candidatus Magnetoovum sp. WYHC-5]|nr:metal ABC transporter ATP-binding protein [Candidatus Magnetoovum sp. WYHC-5]
MSPVDHTQNIIEVENVFFSYGQCDVLKDITLTIHKGDYLGLVGPNGSGKTTLIKVILGLLKPRRGLIRLFGDDIKDFQNWHKISYVPQKTISFEVGFPATVKEVVLMGRYGRRGMFHKVTAEDRKKTEEALKEVNMWNFRDCLIGELSGGQQRRVFIARALASQPEVIFLDEPTVGIDKTNQEELYAILRKLNKDMDLTLVMVSHDIEKIVQETMHIACIDRTLVCHASPEDFLKDSPLQNILGYNIKMIHHRH